MILKSAAHKFRFLILFLIPLGLILAIATNSANPEIKTQSNYEAAFEWPFNQPSYYPIQQILPEDRFQKTGEWVGRLVLPKDEERQQLQGDWTWIEIYEAPDTAQNLIGEVVRLTWVEEPTVEAFVDRVTQNIKFTALARVAASKGNVLPSRLNREEAVGPLRSLAGARPEDDMTVRLGKVAITQDAQGKPVLEISRDPTQITGRFYGLFQILQPIAADKLQPRLDLDQIETVETCPGESPCPSDYFLARAYNSASGTFEGQELTVRIPQQPPTSGGLFYSTPKGIEQSPAGNEGWYLYGASSEKGIFTAQAIAPRKLFQLEPDQVILGTAAGIDYIETANWASTEDRKGTVQSILVDPTAETPEAAMNQWQVGDPALVIHSFGGTGGESGDKVVANTVTGHFAYGTANVIRDPFTQEPQFDVYYQQVYSNNPNAIIAGFHTWADFAGNLQRGWLGTRPISDVVIQWEPFTQDYQFGNVTLSPLKNLMAVLQVMTARYRTGDGTGMSWVTPVTSCVQDSNQGLYMSLEAIKTQYETNPEIQRWLERNPNDPQTLRFQKLLGLLQDLVDFLAPRGVIRPDWKENAEFLAGTTDRDGFVREQDLGNAVLSSESVLPREGYDNVSKIFLQNGARLWFLRANQVGGDDPDIFPMAPTRALGR
ncbi:MAG: abortive infection protein [Microcoleaceae cyanobacterium]